MWGWKVMEERGSHISDLGSGWMVWPFPEVGSTGQGAGWRAEEFCEVLVAPEGQPGESPGACGQTLGTGRELPVCTWGTGINSAYRTGRQS